MTLFEFIFGRRPTTVRGDVEIIASPPADADWRKVKPRKQARVEAHLANDDGEIQTHHGALTYRAGEHYLVTPQNGNVSVVRRDIFERTYRKRIFGGYEKRPDVVYRYFTLPRAAIVQTPEGPQRAEPGDWIMQGVVGELWPVRPDEAESKYAPA